MSVCYQLWKSDLLRLQLQDKRTKKGPKERPSWSSGGLLYLSHVPYAKFPKLLVLERKLSAGGQSQASACQSWSLHFGGHRQLLRQILLCSEELSWPSSLGGSLWPLGMERLCYSWWAPQSTPEFIPVVTPVSTRIIFRMGTATPARETNCGIRGLRLSACKEERCSRLNLIPWPLIHSIKSI